MKRLLPLFALLFISLPRLTGQEPRTQVLLETNKGKIVLELYNETPRHRDNFLEKVRSGAYDGVLFHRVVREFVVQGGNLKSKNLAKGAELEDDADEGTLPPEIMVDRFIHERGALAAARQADEVNPERLSSSTQFYIVTGKYHTAYDLKEIEQVHGRAYTPEQREGYMLRGGAPSLDGAYTVFGRLIEGWGVVDKMQRVEVNDLDRPLRPLVIRRASIYTPKK